MQLKIKRIHPEAVVPSYAHADDAGLDICSVVSMTVPAGEIVLVPTGLIIELPPGTEAQIRPRSGLALKHGMTLVNSPGTIDAGYRGEIKVIMINLGKQEFQITKGMRIAQMVVKPVLQVDILEVEALENRSERDTGGFGSTGLT